MCGIYGHLSTEPATASGVRATDVLAHRGPDDRGTWLGDGVFLGARRLSIIDLAGGAQPIWNEDRTCCIVYNGELYNFPELRGELETKGHVFTTRTDTEVVVHAYEEWGTDALRRLNGMFAFAVWDTRSRSLLLARDRIGEKPLYYYRDAGRLVFASEIKAILEHSDVPRRVDPRGLANYLTFGHATAPATILEGVRKLLPGHYVLARDGRIRVEPYWDVPLDDAPLAAEEATGAIRGLLEDSVSRRLVADVPVGAFLSGGLDSSAVVALMAQRAASPVKTFALGFDGGSAYDELDDARRVAHALGTSHHELRVDHAELLPTLRTLVYHFDEPFGDAASIGVHLLSRFAREHVKVVLTGDGGDELFGGYRRYVADQLAPAYGLLPQALGARAIPALVNGLPGLRRSRRAVDALRVGDPARRYARWLRVFTPDLRAELLGAGASPHDPEAMYDDVFAAGRQAPDHLNRLMYADVKTWLADGYMEKTDKATMACGLEARMPFVDHRLVELAFRVPAKLKIRGLATKRILKQAVRDLVPARTLRKRKHGFAVPIESWLRNGLGSYAREILLDERTLRRGYFDARVVERMWQEHVSRRAVRDNQLWLLLNFELWHRIYLDGEGV